MADTERLAQYETLQENHLGFKGILSGIAEELIPEGFVPDMENLRISTEGIVEAVHLPKHINIPTGIAASAPLSLFMWQKDNGDDVLFAQYSNRLFKYYSATWTELRRAEGTLHGAINNSVTAITTHAASILTVPFTIKIDTEIMHVTNEGSGTDWTVERAQEGTTIAAHNDDSVIYIDAFNSSAKAAYAGGMGNEVYIVNRTTQMLEYDDSTLQHYMPSSGYVSHAPMGDYIAVWKNRIFISGNIKLYATTAAKDTAVSATDYVFGLVYSNLLAEEKNTGSGFDGGFPVGSSLVQFRTAEHSQITGMIPVGENLLIFLESAIFSFSGYSNDSFNAIDIYHGANTPMQNAVVRAGGLYFISGDGIYALGELPQKISKNIDKFLDTTTGNFSCAYWDDRLWFATNGHLVAMNMSTGNWEKYNLTGQDLVYSTPTYLYITNTDGSIYTMGDDDTTLLTWYLETPVLNQGITTADKRYRSIFIYHMAYADAITLVCYPDYSDTATNVTPTVTSSVTGHVWGATDETYTLHWGVDEWSEMSRDIEVSQRSFAIPNGVARTIKIKFSGTGDVGLLGYAITYKPKRKFGIG
jgi:hypothetical protein